MRGGGLPNTASSTAAAGSGRPPLIFYGTHAGLRANVECTISVKLAPSSRIGFTAKTPSLSSGLVSNGQGRFDDRLGTVTVALAVSGLVRRCQFRQRAHDDSLTLSSFTLASSARATAPL